jgi:hypothetical protein
MTLSLAETTEVVNEAYEAACIVIDETLDGGETTIEPAFSKFGLDRAGLAHMVNEHMGIPAASRSDVLIGMLFGLELAQALKPKWEAGRWWRLLAPDGSLKSESSSEAEVRGYYEPGDRLQRLWARTTTESEYRDEEVTGGAADA